jgi:hypothetical protein
MRRWRGARNVKFESRWWIRNQAAHLSAVVLPQQGFDLAMRQHGDIGLDSSRALQFRAFAGIESCHEFTRHSRFSGQ